MDTIYKPIDRLTYLIYKKHISFRNAFDIVYEEMISIMEKEQNNQPKEELISWIPIIKQNS